VQEPTFVTLTDAFVHHHVALQTHGGRIGLLDQGRLESALDAPRNLYLYEAHEMPDREGVALLAGTYWVHVALAHGFADGNKRVAVACALDFLYRNGYDVDFTEEEVEHLGLAVAGHRVKREDLCDLLIDRLQPLLDG
jgi:death-on-curing protein